MSKSDIKDRIKKKIEERRKEEAQPKNEKKEEIEKSVEEKEIYFEPSRNKFWIRNARMDWTEYNEGFVFRHLASKGIDARKGKGEYLSQAEKIIYKVQTENIVDWAGQIAGYPRGCYSICNQQILVTASPIMPQVFRGSFDNLRNYLKQLLRDQLPYFVGWVKSAIESLRKGPTFRSSQVLALAGPSGSGKSLLQSVITEMLGGRSGKPFKYMIGKTDFNKDLIRSEHLMIEDEASSTDLRTRKMVGQMIKNMLVNETQLLHAKQKDAIPVTPFWRLTVSLNEEPENLMVLPPLEKSLMDKIMLFKAHPVKFPFEGSNLEERMKYRKLLSEEIPAFINWLNVYRIQDDLVDQRYGIKAFQNPDLLLALDELSPEVRLMNLIDSIGIWGVNESVWTGGASDLEVLLRQKDGTGEVVRLLTFNSACGVYLSRLKNKYPSRIQEIALGSNKKRWKIHKV